MDLHEAEADRMIGTSTSTSTATATTTASTGDDDNNGDVAPMATDGTDAADTGAGDEAKTPPVEIPFGSAFAVDNLPEHGFSTTGLYKLQAVLTHIGRSADSGHYIAWVRMNDEIWLKFDDNKSVVGYFFFFFFFLLFSLACVHVAMYRLWLALFCVPLMLRLNCWL